MQFGRSLLCSSLLLLVCLLGVNLSRQESLAFSSRLGPFDFHLSKKLLALCLVLLLRATLSALGRSGHLLQLGLLCLEALDLSLKTRRSLLKALFLSLKTTLELILPATSLLLVGELEWKGKEQQRTSR